MLDRLEIGVIISTHGLKGEVNVYPVTDDVRRFDDIDEVYIGEEGRAFHAERVRYFKGRPILKFRECGRIEDAELLKGKSIFVKRGDALNLKEGEYFIGDIIGCEVKLEDGGHFGTLRDVLRTGANDVYAVEKDGGEMVYLPAIRDVVLRIDPGNNSMVVRPMREI